jgi:hypothetical protein
MVLLEVARANTSIDVSHKIIPSYYYYYKDTLHRCPISIIESFYPWLLHACDDWQEGLLLLHGRSGSGLRW